MSIEFNQKITICQKCKEKIVKKEVKNDFDLLDTCDICKSITSVKTVELVEKIEKPD